MAPITSITIVYDEACGLCTRTKDWIRQQAPLVETPVRSSGLIRSATEDSRSFPLSELAVVADTGEVWLGNHAWIVCLWALRELPRPGAEVNQPIARG